MCVKFEILPACKNITQRNPPSSHAQIQIYQIKFSVQTALLESLKPHVVHFVVLVKCTCIM